MIELAHGKVKYGLISGVISCHDRSAKIVRIHARNEQCALRTQTITRILCLSRSRKAMILCSRCAAAASC